MYSQPLYNTENCECGPKQRDMRRTQNLISHCINIKHCLLASVIVVASFVSILVKTCCLSRDSVYVNIR